MKKKALKIGILVASILCIGVLTGCKTEQPQEIVLDFENNGAYFTAQKQLVPIGGDAPAEGDVFEHASITLNAAPASIVVLQILIEEGQAEIEALKISVDGTVYDFQSNAEIFRSTEAVSNVTLDVKIFLAKDAPVSVQNRSLSFYFVLSA